MKSILISIQPQWVEKILNGEKTIEIRKTVPKCELPCKAYIYCTKDKHLGLVIGGGTSDLFWCCDCETAFIAGGYLGNGEVVAEFTLAKVEQIVHYTKDLQDKTKVSPDEFFKYKENKNAFAWHIKDLVVYDRPKELNFIKPYPIKCGGHEVIDCFGCPKKNCQTRIISRPPQSWCYVEDLCQD